MKRFSFAVLEVESTPEFEEQLNEAGRDGFEIKEVLRHDDGTWCAVLQREETGPGTLEAR